ncbi:MAG: hypothetical protein SGPRY_000812 [Prymnesium sp.]
MVQSVILGAFYEDLTNPLYQTNWAIYHRRFSTNTNPKWPLAQPMRSLAHNGEINTLIGNVNWQRALDISRGRRDPLCSLDRSDSANLDTIFENVMRSGKTPAHSLSMLVPEAYRDQPDYEESPEITAMYEYYAGLQEPWDGPALLIFSDGKQLGATLDRNGLRPARFLKTKEGLIGFMSETGVIEVDDSEVELKGRLGPGNMITVDLETGRFRQNFEIKQELAKEAPYGEWLEKHRSIIEPMPFDREMEGEVAPNVVQQLTAFGWSLEDVDMQVGDMSSLGKETLFSLGEDTALAVLSNNPHTMYDYFKQRFAQVGIGEVTNPPIDPLREGIVMSLDMSLGKRGDVIHAPSEELADQLRITSPILNMAELAEVESMKKSTTISTLYPVSAGPDGLKDAVAALVQKAEAAARDGVEVLILSDMKEGGIGAELMLGSTLHHHLIGAGVRMQTSIVAQTAQLSSGLILRPHPKLSPYFVQAWSTHHIACLVGFGASAVHPYLLFSTVWPIREVRRLYDSDKRKKMRDSKQIPNISIEQSFQNTRAALEAGVLKILSKIGISLLSSYQGAQIFEAIGIGEELIKTAFAGTPSRIGGLTFKDLAEEVAVWHADAKFNEDMPKLLRNYGFVKYYQKLEHHAWNPPMSRLLHKALRSTDVKEGERLHLSRRDETCDCPGDGRITW